MTRNKLIILASCTMASLAVILTLHILSKPLQSIPGGFDRQYVSIEPTPLFNVNLKHPGFYIAGHSGDHIYLSHHKSPGYVWVSALRTGDTTRFRIQADIPEYRRLRLTVDSLFFYLSDGTMPLIHAGKPTNWIARPVGSRLPYFTQFATLPDGTFTVVNLSGEKNRIVRLPASGAEPEVFNYLSKGGENEIFSTHGKLLFSHHTNQLIYVYRYRNGIQVLDTSFRINFEIPTIDTLQNPDIRTTAIGESTYTLKRTPMLVNGLVGTHGQLLYVRSHIPAENDAEDFRRYSVIDVYDLSTRTYRYSFRIPNINGRSVADFRITGEHTMAALIDNQLIVFVLNGSANL